MTGHGSEIRLFRFTVFALALIPILAGSAGIVYGAGFPGFAVEAASADLDSHFRFLSGVFLMVGIGFWSCALGLGDAVGRFRFLSLMVFTGGLARLVSLVVQGMPSTGHLSGLAMELIAVPVLVLWHVRLTRRATAAPLSDRRAA